MHRPLTLISRSQETYSSITQAWTYKLFLYVFNLPIYTAACLRRAVQEQSHLLLNTESIAVLLAT